MKNKQAGFTMIELMISLLLGSLLIAGIAQVFLQSSIVFKSQKNLSYMVEDGRYIMELIGQEFRRTGYLINRHDVNNTPSVIFRSDANAVGSGITLASSEYIHGDYKATGFGAVANKYDINHLVFRYQINTGGHCVHKTNGNTLGIPTQAICIQAGHNWTLNASDPDAGNSPCTGQVLNGTADIKTISLYVADNNGVSTLFCKAESNLRDGTVVNNNSGNAIPLMSNVEKMHVLYGVDTDATPDGFANQYVLANAVTNWLLVTSVRINLVIMSEDKNVSKTAPSTYQINGSNYAVNVAAENRFYRVFSTTIAFRNI